TAAGHGEPEQLATGVDRVVDVDDPSLRARRPAHDPQVAAEVDQRTLRASGHEELGGEVGGEPLADAAGVDGDADGEGDGVDAGDQVDARRPGRGLDGGGRRAHDAGDVAEVAVV